MHPNPAFRDSSRELREATIREHPFAAIVATLDGKPRAAHTPVVLANGGDSLHFHLAKANDLTAHLAGSQALALIEGPHGYASAHWYERGGEVPTWNYITYEIAGPVKTIEREALCRLLETIAEENEQRIGGSPWSLDALDPVRRDHLLEAIQGFSLRIESVRETVKLAQHKSAADREKLAARHERAGDRDIAAAIREVTS